MIFFVIIVAFFIKYVMINLHPDNYIVQRRSKMKYYATLYNSIKRFQKDKRISFHMPVHNSGKLYTRNFAKNLLSLDVTELDMTDNLAAPTGAIKKMHQNMADLFGAKNAHILVGGSSSGIHAMLLSCLKSGDKLLVDRCVHSSVINACVMFGIMPVFIERETRPEFFISEPLDTDMVLATVKKHPDAKAILVTSPTYYGIYSPIRAISEIAHDNDMALLVDCAHGSHFAFCNALSPIPTKEGADMCTISLHKTLGAPTQTALLLHNSERISFNALKNCINMVQTTSPSYMLMCAADVICEKMAHEGRKIYKDVTRLTLYAKRIIENNTRCICLPGNSSDMTRLVINFSSYDISGEEIAKNLCDRYKIDVEMADRYNVVCIVSMQNKKKDVDTLAAAIIEILKDVKTIETDNITDDLINNIDMYHTPGEAFFDEGELVDIAQSCGRICSDTVSIYPPGIVCLIPGAMIDTSAIKKLLDAKKQGVRITGLFGENIRVMK